LFNVTQLTNRNNLKSHHANNQNFVEITINENAMAKSLISHILNIELIIAQYFDH